MILYIFPSIPTIVYPSLLLSFLYCPLKIKLLPHFFHSPLHITYIILSLYVGLYPSQSFSFFYVPGSVVTPGSVLNTCR